MQRGGGGGDRGAEERILWPLARCGAGDKEEERDPSKNSITRRCRRLSFAVTSQSSLSLPRHDGSGGTLGLFFFFLQKWHPRTATLPVVAVGSSLLIRLSDRS